MKFLDLFSGIGGFRLGLEKAGHTCVGHVEIDKFAQQSYNAIHKPREDEFFHADITTIGDDELQDLKQRGIDIITGGFPCQSFSIAGHRKGFEDTRGTLFFDIAKLAKEIQPKYLLLENVKGLLNHDKGDTFEVILRTLDEIGYDAEWQVLNSKHFGVPQNRERVFIIGHLRGSGGGKVFPFGRKGESTTTEPGKKTKEIKVVGRIGNGIHDSNRVIDPTGIAQTMQARDYKDPIKVMVKETTEPGERVSQKVVSFDRKNGIGDELEIAHTLNASDWRGLNRNQTQNAVMVKETTKQEINQIGNLIDTDSFGGNPQSGRVYGIDGISPCLQSRDYKDPTKVAVGINQIGNIIDTDSFGGNPRRGRVYGTDGISPSLNTVGGGGLEPKIAIPVLTPDRAEKRQNGRRFKEDGEPMFTITTQDRHGVMVNEPKVAILRPKRTEYGKAIRKDYESGKVDESRHNMTKLEPVFDGVSNTITTVQKDNLLLDQRYIDGMSDAYLQSKNGTFGKINEYPLDGCAPTLTATCYKEPDMIRRGFRIRKLTPKECWRLQGFPDWAFERAKAAGVSDSQLYKQAGNSVTVNVVYEIAKRLY